MTKQQELFVSKSFEPFMQPFEKERVEEIKTPAGNTIEGISHFDVRKFSSEQCMDFYKAFDLAMNSDREDIKDMAMTAGKSAYHYLTHGDIETGDGQLINNSYLVGIPGPNPFESFTPAQQQDLLYELAKGVRIKEQLAILKQSGNILKKAAAMEDMPQNDRQWNNICEAVRIDNTLQDPGHFLSKTLTFERPGSLEKVMKTRQDNLHEYLDKNGLPHDYEELKAHAESVTGESMNELVDLTPKTQWDVPFDRIGAKVSEEGIQVEPFDAIRSAQREAWLIDRMESGNRKDELVQSYFERVYDTIHYEENIQRKEGQNLQFLSGLDEEIKEGRTFANMRRSGSQKTAEFLTGYAAYEEKRDNENLTLTDEDLQGISNNVQAVQQ